MLPTHMFLVDVSFAAISTGATAAVCSAIRQNLDSLPGALWHIVFIFESRFASVCLRVCTCTSCTQTWRLSGSNNGAGGERARIGIATFDSAVQFYALRPGQSAPQMLVVPDTAEPYAPSAVSLLVNAQKARNLVSAFANAQATVSGQCSGGKVRECSPAAAKSRRHGCPDQWLTGTAIP